MGDLIVLEKNELLDEPKEDRVVSINLVNTNKGKAAALLGQIIDCFQLAKESFGDIEPEKRYYLDLTKEMKEKLEKGECWFTEKSANGKPMGQLRHIVDGKNVIMANPDIIAEQVPVAKPADPKQLSNSVYQMALQQQMAEMSKQIAAIQSTVVRIEEGQMDDRFAKIEAGEKTLRLAYKTEDEENRNKLVSNAIPMLQEGSEAIKKVIERRIKDFEEIPSRGRALKMKMWLTPNNYVEKVNKAFDDIQTCFDYYDRAQRLTAMACMMINEPAAMEEVFFQQEKFIKSLELWKLKAMKNLHYNIDFSKEWFSSPKSFLDDTRLQYLDFSNESYDRVSIELEGQQLLEVMNDDKDAGSEN